MNYCKILPLLFLCLLLIWGSGLSLAQTTLPGAFGSNGDSMNYNGETVWLTMREIEARAKVMQLNAEILEIEANNWRLTKINSMQKALYEDIKKQDQINDSLQQEINELRMVFQGEAKYDQADLFAFYNTERKYSKDEASPCLQLPDDLNSYSEIIWTVIHKSKKEIDLLIKKGNSEAAKIVFYDERELGSFPEKIQKKAYLYINSEVEAHKAAVLLEK
jgi:hypothetical protein